MIVSTPCLALRATVAAAVLITGVAAHAAAVPAFDIEVGSMQADDWAQTVVVHQGTGSVSFAIAGKIGAVTDTHWLSSFSKPGASGIDTSQDSVANMYLVQAWNPATQGAVDRLDISLDATSFFSSFASRVGGFLRPVIEQGGTLFSVLGTDLVVLTSSSFSTLSWQLEDTADWRAAGGSAALPDFSASGAPIHFGYRFGLGTSCSSTFGCTGASSNVGVDNLRIDVVPTVTDPGTPGTVPEPPALALLGLAAAAAALSRRRC